MAAAAAAATTSVRGCGPASASSAAFSPRRVVSSSFCPPAPRRSSVRARAVVADVPSPSRGLELRRQENREPGLLESVFGEDGELEEEEVGEERVEGWMRDSIAEIVRHVGEAPFLVHLFQDGDGREGVTVRREPASSEAWPDVRRRWGAGGQRRPDGIILVEQVAAAAVEEGAEAARQVWGLVVQARGMECAACYILDTCRVRSSAGFCTHFCLARAQCSGEPLELQLRNAWLNRLSGHHR